MAVNTNVPIADTKWLNDRTELSNHLAKVLEKQARQSLLAVVIRIFDGWLVMDNGNNAKKYGRRVVQYHKYIEAKLATLEPRRYSLETTLIEHKARNERFIKAIGGK